MTGDKMTSPFKSFFEIKNWNFFVPGRSDAETQVELWNAHL
jgi:hypothetical protein